MHSPRFLVAVFDVVRTYPWLLIPAALILAAELVMVRKNVLPWLLPAVSGAVFAASVFSYFIFGLYPGVEAVIFTSLLVLAGNLLLWRLWGR